MHADSIIENFIEDLELPEGWVWLAKHVAKNSVTYTFVRQEEYGT